MAFNFPLFFSKFIRKRNAEYDGDPNGDYVVAEDVNELQEAIERIEQVVGIEELDDTISHKLQEKLDKKDLSEFGSPLFIRYNGFSISTYPTIEERINAFNYIPHVMLKKEESSSFDFFIQEVKKSGTQLYGIVDCSSANANAIESEVDWFHLKGFHGIFLSKFGFENGLNRSLQNSILQYIRSRSLISIITGEIESTLFNKPHASNPLQQDLFIGPADIYFTEDVFIVNGQKNTSELISAKILQLNKAQKEKNLRIFVEDIVDITNDNRELYSYGKLLSTLYNLDGYSLAPTSRYALNETVQKYLHGFELGKWKADTPIYVEDASRISRSFAKGTIVFDKENNVCKVEGVGLPPNMYTWMDKQVPGSAVDLATADYAAQVVEEIVGAINENNSKIHYSKIDGLNDTGQTADQIKDVVIRAINASPAAVTKNPPSGYEMIAGDNYIHGALVDQLDASAIKTGTLNIDIVKANIIEAINAYIGTAKINKAFITELDAQHITATVVQAINMYSENAGINHAVINSAVIGTLSSNHIKAAVIEAVNTSTENAKINKAKIGELDADNITAGLIEALQISAATGEFDLLKAAVVDAINASIDFANIDGAIIGEGTIEGAQISEASITDAHIVELTAAKIKSGTLDTSIVTLQGQDGRLKITNNRLQVFDDQTIPVERVSLGDVNADGSVYGFRVRGADGTTILLDQDGVREEGITDGAVTNKKIEDGAVDNNKVLENSLTGDRLVIDAITAREIKAREINANHMQLGTLKAGSGIIDKGAIGEAEIGEAQITDAHIKELNANKITAGKIKAQYVEIGTGTFFETGYSPDELRQEMENRIPLRCEIISSNGLSFKNGNISTTLIARVYEGQTEITDTIDASRFAWKRVTMNTASDDEWNAAHVGVKQVSITSIDVTGRAAFLCEVS